MKFEAQIIPYVGDDSWVEVALHQAKHLANLQDCPKHSDSCDIGRFLTQAAHPRRAHNPT